jgi:predicted transcriptional regulator
MKLVKLKPAPKTRNNRVKEINKDEWIKERKRIFGSSIEWAGAAKAYRTVLHVSQTEVGISFGVSAGCVCRWESGHYFKWDAEAFEQYIQVCNEIAEENRERRRA